MVELSGVEQRAKDRGKQSSKRKSKARQIVLKKIDLHKLKDISNSDELQSFFNTIWHTIDQAIKNDKNFKSFKGYIEGYNEAVKFTQELIEKEGFSIGFPKLIVSSERPKLFRTESWFYDAQKVHEIYQDWVKKLEYAGYHLTLIDIMLSLVFHSAVLKLPEIKEILSDINKHKLQTKLIFGLPVVTLLIKDDSYHTNVVIDKSFEHQVNIFLSPITARLIDNYLNEDSSTYSKDSLNINTLYKSMWQTKFLGETKEFIGIKRFLLGAVYVLEENFDFYLPEHTWYLLLGYERTHGLSIQNWQSLVHDITHIAYQDVETATAEVQINSNTKKTYKSDLALDLAKIIRKKGIEKVPKQRFKKELIQIYENLRNTQAPLNEIAIVLWLIKKTENCKVSSIGTYSDTIVYRWLSVSQGMTLEDLSEDEYMSFYRELIELGSTENAKNSIATHLDDIHELLVAEFDIEPITTLSQKGRKHHKTGYISENMFKAVLTITDHNKLNLNQEERNAIKLTLILGQRCGLRIGEIVKIRLNDIAKYLSYLEIRNNKYGDNKTSSALRRVLLDQLLVDEDKTLFKQVYAKRIINKNDTLIASQTGQPYKAQELSKMLSLLIKQATGLNELTTHHLRHSCLTNLQLMSFLNDCPECYKDHEAFQGLCKILPYDLNDVESIIESIQTPLSFKKVHALAGIAGHASPNTTFASYIHLIDIQIGLKLWHTDFKLEKEHAGILKLSRRNKNLIKKPIELNAYLTKKLNNNFPSIPRPKAKKLNNNDKTKNKSRKYGFDEVNTILTKYIDKEDINYWLSLLDIDKRTFETWLDNANKLKMNSKFRTQQNYPRLFEHGDGLQLLPQLDRFTEDRKILSKMTANYRELYYSRSKKRVRSLLNKFVLHTLTHSQYTKNYITFENHNELQDYLEIVCKLVYKKDLRLSVYNFEVSHKSDLVKWSKVLDNLKSSQITYIKTDQIPTYHRTVRAELSLASQTEAERIANQKSPSKFITGWTVRTLQIFCHYVYIMIGHRM